MEKAYKYRIYPNKKQKEIITKTFGCCRFVYNTYLAKRIEMHEKNKETFTYVQCANDMKKLKSELEWLKEVDSTALQSSLKDLDSAYQKFFKEHAGYPKFKSKKTHRFSYKSKCVNGNIQYCDRYIKLPKLGMVKTKNKLIPQGRILNATVSQEPSGKYFVSLCCADIDIHPFDKTGNAVGIDLGIKEFAVISNGAVKKNINKTAKLRKIEKQLKREQRCLSRKYEGLKKRNNKMKGEATRQNIQKQVLKVQKLHQRINNIRTDYINKCVNEIVKTKPSYITIEDLNVKGMMKNRHLSKAVASQKFYEFRTKLEAKCKELGIELRIVDRWYPSSKLCHECGCIKSDLKLSDRVYKCECGYHADRDYNASLNLRDAISYKNSINKHL